MGLIGRIEFLFSLKLNPCLAGVKLKIQRLARNQRK
jgi:hypothetical protein